MADRGFQDLFTPSPKLGIVLWAEHHAYAVLAGRRQEDALSLALGIEEVVWDLEQDACPIACGVVCTGCTAVAEVDQDLPAISDDRVVGVTINMDHGSDAAGIVLVPLFV